MDYSEFIKNASNVVPSQKQLKWFDMEFYAFVHFTVNTYTIWNGEQEKKTRQYSTHTSWIVTKGRYYKVCRHERNDSDCKAS